MGAEAIPAEPAERVRAILERVVDALELDASIDISEDERQITGTIDGEDVGRLIGRRGQTIDAVQFICYRAAQRGATDRKRVIVDAAGYRERRREQVEGQADRAAERALESGKEIELEPMTPTERKVVHDHLAERSGVETFSEGDEPDRCVIVAPLVNGDGDGDGEQKVPELGAEARAKLETVLELLAADPRSLSSVQDPEEAWRAHVADSLTGLEISALHSARAIADVGSGAGFPGLVLAVALPAARVDLIESVARKCEFMRDAAERAGIENVSVVNARSEEHAASAGREAYDVVTARAVARLATLAELASPLLREGGTLVAWKGRRDPDEESELTRASEFLAMAPRKILEVGESAGYEHRHLYAVRKIGRTPENLPRRPGMAKKRPYGSAIRGQQSADP